MIPDFIHIQGNSAGSFTGGGWKLLLHTTEGGSIEGAIGAYKKNNSWPHFTMDFEKKRVVQHLEVNVAARSLQNDNSDGYDTNRARSIQIERVGYAKDAESISTAQLDWEAQIYTIIRNECQRINGDTFSLTYVQDVKLSDKNYVYYSGLLGHKNVPDNNHTDPGNYNYAYVIAKMQGQQPPIENNESIGFKVKNFEASTVKVQTGNNGAGFTDIQLSKDNLVFVGHGWEGDSSKNLDCAAKRLGGGKYRVAVEGAPGAYTISVNVLFAEK